MACEEWTIAIVRSSRLGVVKDQIHVHYLGLGTEEDHHSWLSGRHTLTADTLFNHLVENMTPLHIDLQRKGKFPTEALLKLPCPPDMAVLETRSELGNYVCQKTEMKQEKSRREVAFVSSGFWLGGFTGST